MNQRSSKRCGMARRNDGGAGKAILWIIGLVGLLACLTIGGFPDCGPSAERNRTTAYLAAIRSGLDQYNEKYGHYPEPTAKAENDSGTFDGVTMNRGVAAMLYQAITGDGSNYVKADSKGAPSDGTVEALEVPNSINSNLPPQMIASGGAGRGVSGPRYLVDGYGRPFQYTKGGHVEAVNSTYDIWSYGDEEDATVSRDAATKKDVQKSAKWIKNW